MPDARPLTDEERSEMQRVMNAALTDVRVPPRLGRQADGRVPIPANVLHYKAAVLGLMAVRGPAIYTGCYKCWLANRNTVCTPIMDALLLRTCSTHGGEHGLPSR
jgi:hypothetical protein